jgi:predicted 3-demethylubiquinone-9 3-methyltransferase (glyoxalase superfamily)
MQKITPCLWFDSNAEEAMNFYLSIFKDSKFLSITRYGDLGLGPKGSVLTARFTIHGQEFLVLNGGPKFTFSEAISFIIACETQQEIDEYWEKLSAGGEEQRCGWLKDRYGLSWQIVPSILYDLIQDSESEKSKRVSKAIYQMVKLDINTLKEAYAHG